MAKAVRDGIRDHLGVAEHRFEDHERAHRRYLLPERGSEVQPGRPGWSAAVGRSGVHTVEDVIKALLAGADVAMMTSALLRNGPDHLARVEAGLRAWLAAHGHASPDQLRGRLSQRTIRHPQAWERANYLRTLTSHKTGSG